VIEHAQVLNLLDRGVADDAKGDRKGIGGQVADVARQPDEAVVLHDDADALSVGRAA
jgi:hypothetical protein